jgi:tetratricopeptide (TPR) repeat protein
VISRTSAMMYKGVRRAAQEIGRELGVRYLLEGSVRKAGNNLRITAQLIDTSNDRHLWGDRYAGTLDDVFDMQERVSRAIAAALQMRLSAAEERWLSRRATADGAVFDLYLRARNGILRGSRDGFEAAVRYCEDGLRLTGDSALLHAGLGYAHIQSVTFGFAGDDAIEKAGVHASRALEIDAETAEAYLVLGLIACLRGNHGESVRQLKRALELEPAESDSLYWLGIEYACIGRTAALGAVVDRLAAVDPLHPYLDSLRAMACWNEGRFELAAEWSERGRERLGGDASRFFPAFCYTCAGRTDAALALLDPVATGPTDDFILVSCRFLRAALRADRPALLALLTPAFAAWARRDYWYSYCVAACYMLAGDGELGLDWLENAIDRGFIPLRYYRHHDPFFRTLRGQPRFEELMGRVEREWEKFEV